MTKRVRRTWLETAEAMTKRRTKSDRKKGFRAHLKFAYGITVTEFNRLLSQQNYACAACLKPETVRRRTARKTSRRPRLSVDHCHNTGRVRGLLCLKCNTALGLLRDDPAIVLGLLIYLTGKSAHTADLIRKSREAGISIFVHV
jgi:hypothetical protein